MKDLVVTDVYPYPGQANYHLNDPITITFTAPVDPTTATANTIQISDPNGASPPGRFEVRNNQVLFFPQYLPGYSAMTAYTVTLPAYPINPTLRSLENTPLIKTYTYTFTTGSDVTPDTTNPYVISVSPVNGATGVARDTNITITFSEPIDSSSVTSAFALREVASGTVITGTLCLSNNATVLNFDPEPTATAFPQYLAADTAFEIQLTASLRDNAGNTLQGAPWSSFFTTGAAPVAASARGPFVDTFVDNINEDATQTTAEWNTRVPGALVSEVSAVTVTETDPFTPKQDPTSAIVGPFETASYRSASLLLNSWFATPLSTLAGKRITALYWKHSGTFTASTYNNLVVRIGHTTMTAFPTAVPPAPNNTFSSLYLSGANQVTPTVVCRLASYAPVASSIYPGYVEIPVIGNFTFSGNANDHLIIDIEVSGGTAQNLMSGDSQATAGTPVQCRAVSVAGAYNIITSTNDDASYFMIEFGGSLGGSGIDGNGQATTTISAPVGQNSDIYVTTGGTIDTSRQTDGYGHLKISTMYVAPGATLNIIGPNPCIIRATGTVRIEGRINANGILGTNGAATGNNGGQGGNGGPGGGAGGLGGNGATAGNGANGTDGTGFDRQATQANGAGLLGQGGAAGAGGGGGGYSVAGSQGQSSGAATGGLGGNVWDTVNILYLHGGGGGGGGGGGTALLGAGGGGGGGGGGYIQILTDRNMYIGSAASINAQGGPGGNAAALGQGGGGGAGSGGAILLQALNLTITGTGAVINAQGGAGGQASAGGGAGGPQTPFPISQVLADGRVRIEAQIAGLSNATITPAVQTGTGPNLSGVYNLNPPNVVMSDAYSTFIDTGCSAPQYGNAEIQYSDSSSPQARVYINFIGADPDILSQPTISVTYLYPMANPEPLPLGGTIANVALGPLPGNIQPGYINGSPASQAGTSLNGLRFIRFRCQLTTTDANTTAQVGQVTINYSY